MSRYTRDLTKMISSLLGRELRPRLTGDPVPESGNLTFELATLVFGVDPIENALVIRLETDPLVRTLRIYAVA